jgi:dihydrolipoamide dehydrogenase
LTGGLTGLAKQRKVTVVYGSGRFTSSNELVVDAEDGSSTTVSFESAIIAAGSEPVRLPFIPHDDPRVIDSTGARSCGRSPPLLVIGGARPEMATVYHELGSRITVVVDEPAHPGSGQGHRDRSRAGSASGGTRTCSPRRRSPRSR